MCVYDDVYVCCMCLNKQMSYDATTLNVHEDCVFLGSFVVVVGDLSTLTIPQSVRFIADYFISDCTDLQEVVVPSSVAYVGQRAFQKCENLTIYCEAKSQPNAWDKKWNENKDGALLPVVWGYNTKY